MQYTQEQRTRISEEAKGKTVESMEWDADYPGGGYWVMTFTDGSEISVRLMAELANSEPTTELRKGSRRRGRVRVTLRGAAESSFAELYLPIENVVSAIADFVPSDGTPLHVEELYANGDGVRVTVERVPKVAP